jgi:hypothetical protein
MWTIRSLFGSSRFQYRFWPDGSDVAGCGVVIAHNSDPLIRYHINCIHSEAKWGIKHFLYTRLISKAVDTAHISDLSPLGILL